MKKTLLSFIMMLCLGLFSLQAQVIISEIMYNPPEAGSDSLEFVELYNETNAAIDLEGWSFSGFTLELGTGVSIPANGYLVVAVNANAMQAVFGAQAIEWDAGGLSNGGETIQVLDGQLNIIDEVDYDNSAPWPNEANALGYSMELCDLAADNSMGENWKKSGTSTGQTINNLEVYASPGTTNGANCLPDADFTILAQGLTFTPADITITQGQSVLWVNQGGNHNVNGSTAVFPNNPEGFSNGALSNDTWTFVQVFNVPGTYDYQCDAHIGQGMVGTIEVLPYTAPDVVITEFMFNDPGPDSLEYIELFNQGSSDIDLSNWVFSAGVTHTFPVGTMLPAGGYLVLAKYADYFNSFFGFTPMQWQTGALTNGGELVELRDGFGNVIDQFAYEPDSPWPTGTSGQGSSVVLCDPASDNAQAGNWIAATTPAGFSLNGTAVLANPNAPSGCSGNTDASNDMATLAQNTDVLIDVLANDFLPGGLTGLSVNSGPSNGTAVVQGDSILYTPGIDFCGADQFTYEACTGAGCDIATVDITVICYDQYTLQQATAVDADGIALLDGLGAELVGVVHGVNLRPNGLQFWIIDPSNHGIGVFNNSGNLGYTVQEGDALKIRGTISQYAGLTQINPDQIEIIGSGEPTVDPLITTLHQENTESRLLRFNNLRLIDPSEWTTGMGNSGFTVRAVSDNALNDTVSIRIDRDVSLYDFAPPMGINFDLIGIGSQFDLSNPFTSGYQVLPRYDADILWDVSNQEQVLDVEINVAPNPTSDRLWIRAAEQLDRFVVYNAFGQTLQSQNKPAQFTQVDLSDYAQGIYLIRFEKAGKSRTETVQVLH